MPEFRYAQFCPVARAAEVIGQRWTLLVLRELLLGPQRFGDLRERLPGISSSVLAERLATLEAAGLCRRETLPPPAGASVYTLTERGRAAEPLLIAAARFGLMLLEPPQPGDHVEPDWVKLAAHAFLRRAATPARRFEIRAEHEARSSTFRIEGGPDGARLCEDDAQVDAAVAGAPLVLLGLLRGVLDPRELAAAGALRIEGDPDALAELPALFDMSSPGSEAGIPPAAPEREGEIR